MKQESSAPEGRPDGTRPGRLGRLVAISSWLVLGVILSACFLVYAGDWWEPATLLLFGPRWLLVVPLVPLLLAAAWWRPRALPVLILALVLALGPLMSFNVPWRGTKPTASPSLRLRVMTCNIHYKRAQKNLLQHLLDDAAPDIVAIQEPSTEEKFEEFAHDKWHVHYVHGLFLASRYPIRKTERLGKSSMRVPGSLMRYELETPAGIITVFSLHFASPREGLYDASHHPEAKSEELQDNSEVRLRQSEKVAELAGTETNPVLLMGDFNTPPESVIFRQVWQPYRDAFTEAGWGWGYTFFGGRTVVRIDHILAGQGWTCERCWVAPSVGSPHHPVLADLVLTKRSE